MSVRLSIRCFSGASFEHSHDFPQLVITLRGAAENFTDVGDGRIGPGQGIVFPVGCKHCCKPDPDSRFLVADLNELPPALCDLGHPIVSIPLSLQVYCRFIERQFKHRVNKVLELGIGTLFEQLLDNSVFLPRIDPRIAKILEYFENNLSTATELSELASLATLSLSQFKKLFKKETGKTPGQYLQMLRMEKAGALLAYTDYPLVIVAEMVGYKDVSSFSRRFSTYFGHSPKNSRKQ